MNLDVKSYLKENNISFEVFTHPPVYTVEDAEKHIMAIKGKHLKNLFLKERKSRNFYLVILPSDKKADIQEIGKFVEEKLKFANETDLRNLMGLAPGAVSPFGLINDKENKIVVLVFDSVWNSEHVSFHPNINTETLELRKEDFHKYMELVGNKILLFKE